MKKYHPIVITTLLILCLVGSLPLSGQRRVIPSSLVGVDLQKVQQQLIKKIVKGTDSLIPFYGDVLFFEGKHGQAYHMYARADSLGLSLTKEQKRNFTHAGHFIGKEAPYKTQTGYFSTDWQPRVKVQKFCLNSPQEDFAPYVWNDLIFITSSRQIETNRQQDQYRFTQLPFLNIFAFDRECQQMDLTFLPDGVSSRFHDGPLSLAKDTSLLIITRNYRRPNMASYQNLYLDVYARNNNQWEKQDFPYNDPAYSLQHPYFDDASSTLYFSSDMPGGYGGFDIYTSVWDGENWSEPENLGPEVNSLYDEAFPSLSPNGNLVFATNHIESMGGLDLVKFMDGKRYLFPEPFNSMYDDLTITYIDENLGYFASNRRQHVFNDDIYIFFIEPTPFLVRVVDQATELPLPGVRVGYNAISPELDGQLITPLDGEGLLHTGHEDPFEIELRLAKEGYQPKEITTDEFVSEENKWVVTVALEAKPVELTIEEVIPDGFFVVYFDNDHPDPDSWSTTTDLSYDETFVAFKERWPEFYQRSASSHEELDAFFSEAEVGMYQLEYLAGFLTTEFAQGRQYIIEFTSHASPLATNEYNLNLSKRRFVSVENFLKSWDEGTLMSFMNQHLLDYDNNPFGAALAPPTVSGDPRDPARSIYSVEASRERRVTISWRRDVSR